MSERPGLRVPIICTFILGSTFACDSMGSQPSGGRGERETWSAPSLWAQIGDVTLELRDGGQNGHGWLWRPADVVRSSTGEMFVMDTAEQVIQVFAADGRYLRGIGRRGEGPGEFIGLSAIGLGTGDTLVAWDSRLRRITQFSPSHDLLSAERLGGEAGALSPVDLGAFRWELLPGVAVVGERMLTSPTQGQGSVVRKAELVIVDLTNGALARIPGLPMGLEQRENGTFVGSLLHPTISGGNWDVARSSAEIRVADSEVGAWSIAAYSLDGHLVRRDRLERERAPVTDQDVRAARRYLLERGHQAFGGTAPSAFRDAVEALPIPDEAPAIRKVMAGPGGESWVLRWTPPWEKGGAHRVYDVLDGSGTYVGEVALDAALGEVLAIEEDLIFLLSTWPSGAPRIRGHEIVCVAETCGG